jgi:catechol 2,3-dioxygenase-like lactoylglutathione lyase family enzyme
MSIGRLDATALDCEDPEELAAFYQSILGGEIHAIPDGRWVEVQTPAGTVACQRIERYVPPTWPEGDVPTQAHIDIAAHDLEEGERAVTHLGARKATVQPSPENFRVFFDPAGHPFCLVIDWRA